jgi:nucleotide-binding universal stress UspA family protein
MHVLVPFDVVPVSRRVPLGVAPPSERAVRYAARVFGPREGARITAVHLAREGEEMPENIGRGEIEGIAEEEGVPVEATVRSLGEADSMAAIRAGILDIVAESGVDAVVMGYEEKSFVEELFHESTASRVLEEYGVPVTLVP